MAINRLPLRRSRGHHGLGQTDDGGAIAVNPISASTPGLISSNLNFTDILGMSPTASPSMVASYLGSSISPSGAAMTASGANSQAPWYAPLLASGVAAGSQIANYELNPLYQKSTFYQTPQGTIYASNVPSAGIPGFPSTQIAGMMPLLLIGGVGLVVVMMMMKR